MVSDDQSLLELKNAIQDGTFPNADALLTTELDIRCTAQLEAALTHAKEDLSSEIRDASKQEASSVDEWIAQARRVQDDIARCKMEARNIVEEHKRVETLRAAGHDAQKKVELLEEEIAFSKSLEQELEAVGEITQVLSEIDGDLMQSRAISAAGKLVSIQSSLPRISAGQTRHLLEHSQKLMLERCCSSLQTLLEDELSIDQDEHNLYVTVRADEQTTPAVPEHGTTQDIIESLVQLKALPNAAMSVMRKLELSLGSVLSLNSTLFPVTATVEKATLAIQLAEIRPQTLVLLNILQTIIQYLRDVLPVSLHKDVAQPLLARLMPSIVNQWLNTAVPYNLHELQGLHELQTEVSHVADLLARLSWPGHAELTAWIEDIPRTWLTKRRTGSLDAIRKAFSSAVGRLREVERIERQALAKVIDDVEDDWSADWDDELKPKPANPSKESEEQDEDDDASGWDFETEDETANVDAQVQVGKGEEDDEGADAWGWGDDLPDEEKKQNVSTATNAAANGRQSSTKSHDEVVLKEVYHITDVPDYLLDVIGKDLSDSQTLSTSTSETYFKSSAPVSALQALPTLTLAMFRATAPTYYSLSPKLSNMNLYNDTLYINEKLAENLDSSSQNSLGPALEAMSKFARQIYTRELETQRTILSDLLDGAQGFVSCTRFPYNQECTNTVVAVIDRIRQLSTEWNGILGQSHLLQSIGTLTAMVMGKIIHDILDMEDISEPESKQLVEHCQKIATLEDLFVSASAPLRPEIASSDTHLQMQTSEEQVQQRVSSIPVYVHNYLRFMYLINILDSSLADIKYMWTEGELKLEFQAEEVADLIKALFAESALRRGAINEIKKS